MLASLSKTLTAAILSLSLAIGAIGASTTPARADNNDAAAVIGGLIALYAIGRAISNHNDRNTHAAPIHHPPRVVPHPRARVAPARCFIEGRDNNGYYRGYLRRCMQNHVARADLLPRNCLRQVHTQRGQRNIYGGRCLFNNGWVRG